MLRSDPRAQLDATLTTLPPGPLLVLLSGGLDSSALLHAAARSDAARARGLAALHVDHGLHPDSMRWSDHCRRLAASLSVPLTVAKVEVPRQSGLGLEAAARRARYDAVARALPPGGIALAAHHADDQAETVLLRLLRGAGPRALAGMRTLRPLPPGWLARPWLELPRAALRHYAQACGLEWLEDPANASLEHDRNYLRAQVLPLLAQRWPGAAQRICGSARLLAAAGHELERSASAALAACAVPDAGALSVSALAALDDFLLGEALRTWLARRALPPPPIRVLARVRAELIDARPDGTPRLAWRGAELRRYRDALHALSPRPRLDPGWTHAWNGSEPLELPPGLGSLALTGPAPAELRVSLRRGGERIVLAPRRPAQSVKHLLQQHGVPPWERTRLPLLWRGNELWAVGDRIIAHEFAEWQRKHGARYLWQRFAIAAEAR